MSELNLANQWQFEDVSACPACQSTRSANVFRRAIQGVPLAFSKCNSCGLIYQNPRFTHESAAAYFSSDTFIRQDPEGDKLDEIIGYPDYFAWDASYTKTAALRLKRIAKFKSPPGDLLEIGPATGSFLDAARSFGFRVHGVDLSSKFAEMARKKYGLDIDVSYVEEMRPSAVKYDVVCNFGGIACWRDPIRALSNVHQTLKDDGVFAINYFDVDSIPGKSLGHSHFEYNHASLVIYSKSTMQQCLRQAGFEVVFSESERQYASFGRIAGYLKQSLALKMLKALGLDDLTVPMIVPGTIFSICRRAH